ncbi:MAG TPA: hypothetical protein VHV51_13070 [Polyangiaceae bacterium]|nr:hypothetical protein [Polyangiaceae bacterium]
MSFAAIPAEVDGFGSGEVSLVGPEVLRELLRAADEDGYLSVVLNPPGPGQRGELALFISEAIDGALEQRGACPPGVGAATDLGAALSDQLYRARLIELRGLALALPTLEGIANLAGALDAEDSAVLRWWIAATRERPVRFYIDARNRYAGVYGRPLPLQELLDLRTFSRAPAPALAPEVSASSEAMELSAPPPIAALFDELDRAEPTQQEAATSLEGCDDESLEADASELPLAEQPEPENRASEPISVDFSAELVAALGQPETAEVALTPSPCIAIEASTIEAEAEPLASELDTQATPTEAEITARAHEPARTQPSAAEASDVAFSHEPLFPDAAGEWRTWLHDLEAARGPKPLAAVERMFVTSYVPLCDAYARGIATAEAKRTLDTWSASFEQSYKEAFDALRVRGKRPTMVLDVPELAQRMGRLHGARSVQLVLVDGLRFDLGLRVEQRLRALLGQGAALTERLLLWSALPATTAVQLELIGRGAEALRDFSGDADNDVPVARGRMATTLRRIKAGYRELLKLDVVESRMSEPDGDEITRLDELADETARSLGAYMKRLPARTLVFVFGDHGFTLAPRGSGTTRARHGGASPEEVLVPAFAWLVGGVH